MTDSTGLFDTLPDASAPYVLGPGEGDHRHFFDHLATRKLSAGPSSSMTATVFTAPCGFGPPLHVHHDEDELMVILDGELVARSDDSQEIAGAGAIVHLPHGAPHSFQVLSPSATFVVVSGSNTAEPVFDRFVATLGAPLSEPVLPEPVGVDPGLVAEASASHGMELLGPPPAPLD